MPPPTDLTRPPRTPPTRRPTLVRDGARLLETPIGAFRNVTHARPSRTLRIDLPCEAAGMAAPPCDLRFRMLRSGDEWMLLAETPPGRPAQVSRWLRPHRPTHVFVAGGLAPRTVRARFDRPPRGWRPFLWSDLVQHVEVRPDSNASILVQGDAGLLDAFLADVQATAPTALGNDVPAHPHDVLTRQQREVLSLAVSLGYYDAQRRVGLHALAKRMGLDERTASALLRDGERLVIRSIIDGTEG